MTENKLRGPEILVYITKAGKFRARIKPKNEPNYEVTIGGLNWMEGLANEHMKVIFNKIDNIHHNASEERLRLIKKYNKNGQL